MGKWVVKQMGRRISRWMDLEERKNLKVQRKFVVFEWGKIQT